MYYKKLLTLSSAIQLFCGFLALFLFILEWRVFGLLIPVYAIGVVHIFCGFWCLIEVYRKAKITMRLYVSGACISAASMAVSITLIAVSCVDLKDIDVYANYYRTAPSDALVPNADHNQVLIGFSYMFLLLALVAGGAAFSQFLVCIIRLTRNTENITLPTRILESRLHNGVRRSSGYHEMNDEPVDETKI